MQIKLLVVVVVVVVVASGAKRGKHTTGAKRGQYATGAKNRKACNPSAGMQPVQPRANGFLPDRLGKKNVCSDTETKGRSWPRESAQAGRGLTVLELAAQKNGVFTPHETSLL